MLTLRHSHFIRICKKQTDINTVSEFYIENKLFDTIKQIWLRQLITAFVVNFQNLKSHCVSTVLSKILRNFSKESFVEFMFDLNILTN